ncbi:MAG: Mut7-C RNAse domain-containing protein [Candidatus Krumholzibacteriia bacterium]
MPVITLEFAGDLADLVRTGRRGRSGPRLERTLPEVPALKDAIEAAGVPHVEVGGAVTGDGRRLALTGPAPTDTVAVILPADPYPLDPPRFVCDQHLGKLARLLRVMGFDTAWHRHWIEPDVARCALNERRAVLTRSRALLMRRAILDGLLVRSDLVDAQAVEVVRRFLLADRVELFGRCSVCNGRLEPVRKDVVADRIPPRTAAWLDEYDLCSDCDRLFWKGTHVERLRKRVAAVVGRAGV